MQKRGHELELELEQGEVYRRLWRGENEMIN